MEVNNTTIKITTAWGSVFLAFSWSEIAAMFATAYTALLIIEWLWKHGLRGGLRVLWKRVHKALDAIQGKKE